MPFSQGAQVVKNLHSCRRHKKCEFDAWVGKIPWSTKWQPTLVFLLEKSHGQRSLVGYSPWGHKESDMTEYIPHTHTHTHTHNFSVTPSLGFWALLLLIVRTWDFFGDHPVGSW